VLIVRIELLPNGNERKRRVLGTLQIANDLTGTLERGNYEFLAAGAGVKRQAGRVDGFERADMTHLHLDFETRSASTSKRSAWTATPKARKCSCWRGRWMTAEPNCGLARSDARLGLVFLASARLRSHDVKSRLELRLRARHPEALPRHRLPDLAVARPVRPRPLRHPPPSS
jgi:hypothetical protein